MSFPIQLFTFCLPALVYAALRCRTDSWRDVRASLGWRSCTRMDVALALVVAAIGIALGTTLMRWVPVELLTAAGSNGANYVGWEPSLVNVGLALLREGLYVALGEEIFFRGLLGGWLTRRVGFKIGNLLQTLAFLLPHLLLLALVSPSLWPLLVVPGSFGWLAGWLRHRSGSIVPGWLAHTLMNGVAVIFLRP